MLIVCRNQPDGYFLASSRPITARFLGHCHPHIHLFWGNKFGVNTANVPTSTVFYRFRPMTEHNTPSLLPSTANIRSLIPKRGSSKSIQAYFSILNVSSNTSLCMCLCMCACVSEIQCIHLFTFV